MHKSRKMARKTPDFWWDFDGKNLDVIVQSDWPGGEMLAIFTAALGTIGRDYQIAQAESLIAEYKSGRKTPPWYRTERK